MVLEELYGSFCVFCIALTLIIGVWIALNVKASEQRRWNLVGYISFIWSMNSINSTLKFFGRGDSKPKGILPPGPYGWPFVGYIQFVLANKPTQLMLQLRRKYGNVFGFRIGNNYCVMLSDFKSVREGFTKKQLQDRPDNYMRMSAEHKTMAELKGAEWEEQRAFLVKSLKAIGVGRPEFENSVQDGLSRAIHKMEQFAGKPECNIRDVISGSINNLIFRVFFGRWFEDDHPFMTQFQHFQTLLVESFSNNMSIIFFPWIDKLLSKFQPHMKETLKTAAAIEEFVRSELAAHEKAHTGSSEHDYMDMFLAELKKRAETDNISTFTGNQLVYNCLLFLLAGTDTVRNTLEWLLMALAIHPDIQKKVQDEIDNVIGRERAPQYSDKSSLPYTEAVIYESERWKTLVPLNVLRQATEDTTIQGYFIPRGTIIINNLHYCHMDPNYWQSPTEFLPERFLSADKSKVIVPEYFMPFSIGRRDCPGDKMSNIEIFLFFTSLMQRFKFTPSDGGVDFSASHRMNLQAHRPILKVERR